MSESLLVKKENSTSKEYMHRDGKTIQVESTLKEGEQVFVEQGVGTLLVTEVANMLELSPISG